MYSQWLETQNQSYRKEALTRLIDSVDRADCNIAPTQLVSTKRAKWQFATDFIVRKDNYESHIHAIERLTLSGKPDEFIPIRLVSSNKLAKRDKILLAFDSLVLSDAFKHEISHGKIIYGRNF
jgi:hypothetical protein